MLQSIVVSTYYWRPWTDAAVPRTALEWKECLELGNGRHRFYDQFVGNSVRQRLDLLLYAL